MREITLRALPEHGGTPEPQTLAPEGAMLRRMQDRRSHLAAGLRAARESMPCGK